MDHQEIDECQIPERYLQRKLAAEETERFEEHLLECPECLERLELAERFQVALRDVVAEDAAREATRAGLLAALARLGRWRGLGFVIAAVLLLPSAFLVLRLDRLESERARLEQRLEQALAPRVDPPRMRLGSQRGSPGQDPATHRVTVTSQPEWIVLVLEADAVADADVCDVSLDGPGIAWRAEAAGRDPRGDVVLWLHSTTLAPGDHRAVISCASPAGADTRRTEFSFRVVSDQ